MKKLIILFALMSLGNMSICLAQVNFKGDATSRKIEYKGQELVSDKPLDEKIFISVSPEKITMGSETFDVILIANPQREKTRYRIWYKVPLRDGASYDFSVEYIEWDKLTNKLYERFDSGDEKTIIIIYSLE